MIRTYLLVTLLAACGASTSTDSAALTASDSWPQLGYDVGHTQHNTTEVAIDSTTVAGLHVAWTATTGLAPGDPSLASGRVYIGSANNTLYAFNALTGHRVWRAFATRDVKSTPAAAFGIVAFTADDGILYVVDARTGVLQWTANVGDTKIAFDSSHSSPAIANGMIYVSGPTALFVFDVHGTPLWSASIPPINTGATAQLALGSNLVFAMGDTPSNENEIRAFTAAGCGAATCNPVWTFGIGNDQGGSLLAANSQVYVQNEAGIYGVRAVGDRINWDEFTPDRDGWPAYANGVMFVTTRDGLVMGGLQAFDATHIDSTPIWRTAPDYARAPAIVNDVVFVLEGNPEVLTAYKVDCGTGGATCTPLWRDTAPVGRLDASVTGTARAIVAGGMVFIGDRETNALRALTL